MHPKLSVVIISAGTSPWVHEIVRRCKVFSSDIVVVSNNQAFIAAQAHDPSTTTRWIFREFEGYGNQKNFGASLAEHDWIVNLDDDELPSTSLLNHLCQWKKPDPNTRAIRIRRINFCNGSAVSWGKWNDDYSSRIYHTSCQWDDRLLHESLIVPKHEIQTIQWPLYHLTANHFDNFLKKTKEYRNKRAVSLGGKRYVGWSTLKTLFSSLVYLEWLEGVNGLYLTLTRSLERN